MVFYRIASECIEVIGIVHRRADIDARAGALQEAEADEMCNTQRYERSPDRVDTRTGNYKRKLPTKTGEGDSIRGFRLYVPLLREDPETILSTIG
jgi:hypothetical protein